MKKYFITGITVFFMIASIDAVHAALPQTISKGLLFNSDFISPVEPADSALIDIESRYKVSLSRLKQQADALKTFLKANNYNTEYCFLVDMSIPSGKNRFFVYNLTTDVIEQTSLVSHGLGSNRRDENNELQFSNEPSTFKTSLGRYRIGSSYTGKFGLAFKLLGLDKTNDKAYERAIVLHAHHSIPATETYPYEISVSLGCPTVAPSFLGTLNDYISKSGKPILMWIYK